MIEQYVNANSLSCLFNRNKSIEIIPEPFRMQGSVSFRVTYSEYSNYILSLSPETSIVLTSDLSYMKNLATTKNPKLYSCFLKDMSFAIAKEIWYAESYKKNASIILPASFNGKDLLVSECLKSYEYCKNLEVEFLSMLSEINYTLNKIKSLHNELLFKLSIVLFSTSNVPTIMEEVNLVYDIFK